MPRSARQESNSGIYHVILRGINRQRIFEDEEDYACFLDILNDCRTVSGFELYAYCLMSNHIHLLLRAGKESPGMIFRRIGAKFVYWYNTKYDRTGHLFQDRFRSEVVENDEYFLTVMRYIHQNPVKAGICSEPQEYPYSSFARYFDDVLIESSFIEEMIGRDEFDRYNREKNDDACLEVSEQIRPRTTDEQARVLMKRISGCGNAAEFQQIPKARQEKSLQEMLKAGVSIRQACRLTGLSFGFVRRFI